MSSNRSHVISAGEKSSQDLEEEIRNKRPTVEELLRMLTSSSSSESSKRTSPPPIPPKPKRGFEMSIEAARRSLGLLSPKSQENQPQATPARRINNRTFQVNHEGGDQIDSHLIHNHHHHPDDDEDKVIRVKLDSMQLDTDTLTHSPKRLAFYENNQPPSPMKSTTINKQPATRTVTKLKAAPPKSHGGCVVYNSASSTNIVYQHQPSMNSGSNATASTGHQSTKPTLIDGRRNEPFVTESPEEANNNIIRRSGNNTSTVEILEVPVVGRPSRDIHSNQSMAASNKTTTPFSTGRNNVNDTMQHHQQQPQYSTSTATATESNNYRTRPYATNLVITPTTTLAEVVGINHAGDCRDFNYDLDTQLANEVQTIMSDSLTSEGQPLRTSTPTPSTHYQIDSESSSGASTATNNNRSSHIAYSSRHDGCATNTSTTLRTTQSSDNTSEGDTLNISRDTDESANTSAHNQSGCELIGVNDNSDSKDSSKKLNQLEQEQEQAPYTVQFFNDTSLMSPSSYSPPEPTSQQSSTDSTAAKSASTHNNNNNNNHHHQRFEMSMHELENNSLKKLVTSLQDDIEALNNKVESLSNKVEDLEGKLDQQKRGSLLDKSTAAIYNSESQQHDVGYQSSSINTKHSPLSASFSTINKLTPMKNSRHNSSYGLNSTFSRGGSAATSAGSTHHLSQQHQKPTTTNSYTLSTNAKRSHQQQLSQGSTTRQQQMRKANMYTSTSSLYGADSNKSGSASISPTPLDSSSINTSNTQARQYASPPSYLSMTHQKRDPSAYTSMLSLSSIGNSTLKKASIAGSVSNLSQFSTSQLSNWPSMSNFLTAKHQAKDILYDEGDQVIRMVLYDSLITMRVPSWLRDDYCLDGVVMEPPPVKLKLDWVHGYRGRDCRSNIYYLPTGECIYFVSSIVVLYHPDEKSQRHYLGHTDSVKCLAVHPNKLIVASGQSAIANRRDKRPIVRVWNTVSLATLRVIGFNEDFDRSICCLAFSKHDAGATLAVVDESSEHTITLLDWQREKNWRVAEVNSGHEPVLAIDFHPIDKYSLVAVGKSSINFWDIRGMTLAKKAGLFDKYDRPKYVICMTFNDIGETITGDSNGNIIIWPRGSNKPRRIIRDAHPGGVFSVLAMKDGSYLTGGRDRRVVEWDENLEPTGRHAELPEHCGGVRFITYARGFQVFIGTLRNAILLGSIDTDFKIIVQGHAEATAALAIHPLEPKYLTGGFDEQIHLIDSNTHTLEWSKCLAMPISAASFSPNGLLLIVGSTSGNWLALDAITQEVLFTACDGTGTVNCVKFSPNGEYFSLGSSDCQVHIYQTTPEGNTFARVGTCVGHSAPIKEIDWSHDSYYIQSQSMNFELLFWRAHNCRPVDNNDDLVHDLRWATHNCTIGFNVIGIWSDSIDSALINYCDKSNNDKLVASVTDTGYIDVYKWPTYYNQCLSQKFNGNVDKFNFIKFLQDDSKLIAVGAKSCATTEWSIITED